MLREAATPVGFIAVSDFAKARLFYEGTLGLEFVSQDDFAMVMRSGPIVIRLAVPPTLLVAPYTIFGWRVDDIEALAASLTAKGVIFERYSVFGDAQAANGVWTAPGGDKVAWFKDLDGNLLSLSQHVD
jgi:catechol 2,3-dioxygenase-like lactoylglutathione lyase family enzyme